MWRLLTSAKHERINKNRHTGTIRPKLRFGLLIGLGGGGCGKRSNFLLKSIDKAIAVWQKKQVIGTLALCKLENKIIVM